MNAKLLRVGLTIINVASGIGLLVAAIQIQAVPILAQTYENCEYDEESYCDEGEACCDDTCYDPEYFICTCEGTLEEKD